MISISLLQDIDLMVLALTALKRVILVILSNKHIPNIISPLQLRKILLLTDIFNNNLQDAKQII